MAKEIFKQIKEVKVPEIFIDDLPEKHRQNFQLEFNDIIDPMVPENLRFKFKNQLKKKLSEKRLILIDEIEIEKTYKTELGDIRVDVVLKNKNEIIFIEPFFSNPIDNDKMKKLSLLKMATLSLDLSRVMKIPDQNYTKDNLERFIISDESKKWIFLSDYEILIKKYLEYLLSEIEKFNPIISEYQSKINQIGLLNLEIDSRNEKIRVIQNEILEIKEKIDIREEELNILISKII